ncbi:FHS family L-fucose permease-like MFS transporter [Rhizomicrobium palustre]|uniref:FHS family L-fucose permease-like MFS transporter n=1 Tax=Rhizomicrobium palustre TaxID=189966 RepID=A0A846MUJ6_9PROT|nr:sugar MFS transporter [Rhizomicrobium palustre]NIK86750.1 FHS family L-fucose permease-like MFS transporter [Rhizomicrobium palustre]
MPKQGLFRAADGKNMLATFVLVTLLFLLWGFCNGLIDVLNKHFQTTLHISRAQSGLVQTANYIAYFLMAIPAGLLARRFGYKGGIIIGLVLIAAGAFWFVPAIEIGAYWAFLLGLFVLAAGLTCLETIANPYTTVLGPAETGAIRINIAQTFNGIGWILGPLVGGYFIFGQEGQNSNAGLFVPYIGVGIVVVLLIAVFVFAYVPDISAEEEAAQASGAGKPLWKRSHFLFGVVAQFLYVAAQSGIFGFFINYVLENKPGITSQEAANWLGMFGFGLFLVGRIFGSVAISLSKPHRVLAIYAVINVVACLAAMLGGMPGLIGLFASFFFMSIMFPTIFALGIHGLGEHTKLGSSLIVMAIVGGAIAPPFMGHIADVYSMRLGFALPALCFGLIAAYGVFWPRLSKAAV